MTDSAGYVEAARGIAAYLASRQQATGAFPGPDHYGLAAAVWLWSQFREFGETAARALTRLEAAPPTSHGEFNVYALSSCGERAVRHGIRFGARHSANWMLLR